MGFRAILPPNGSAQQGRAEAAQERSAPGCVIGGCDAYEWLRAPAGPLDIPIPAAALRAAYSIFQLARANSARAADRIRRVR